MATDGDLVHDGAVPDDVINEVYAALPEYDDDNPFSLIASVFLIDEKLGLTRDGDRFVMQAALSGMLLPVVAIVEPAKLVTLYDKALQEPDDDARRAIYEQIGEMFTEWFTIRFEGKHPETGEQLDFGPLHGKTITIRLLTLEESDEADFDVASVREDGTLISVAQPQQF